VVDPECMKTLDCISVCPNDALHIGAGRPAIFARQSVREGGTRKPRMAWWKVTRWRSYSGWEELMVATLFLLAFFTFRGLYGSVPFLLALGVAALMAYGALQVLRLAYKSTVKVQNYSLKQTGSLTGAGYVYCSFSLLTLAFWLHSGYVHYHRAAAERGYDSLSPVIAEWFNGPAELSDGDLELAERALEHANIAMRLSPLSLFPREHWELAMLTGWLELVLGDEESFQANLLEASELRPEDPVSHDGLANFHASAGRVEEANRWFQLATEVTPEDPERWIRWSHWLASAGLPERAREVLDDGAQAGAAEGQLLQHLGRIELGFGLLDEARQAFERAIEVDPSLVEARLSLASLYCEAERFAEGLELYELVIESAYDDMSVRLSATLAATILGDLERAEHHAQAARELAPGRPEPLVALSDLASRRGDEAEAERLRKEAERRATFLGR